MVQWLRLCAFNAGALGLIPSQGIKIPYAAWHGQILKNSVLTAEDFRDHRSRAVRGSRGGERHSN